MPRSLAIAAARRTISPTMPSSFASSTFSDSIWRLGITSTCVGACGLMSSNASSCSSSKTILPGTSRRTILQKRQSAMSGPLDHDRPRDALKVVSQAHHSETGRGGDQLGDSRVLTYADLENHDATRL